MKTYWLGGVCAALLLAACSEPVDAPAENTEDTASGAAMTDGTSGTDTVMAEADPRLGEFGVETQHISETVDPGDDFFTYVNEGWLETAEYPPGFSSLNGFTELYLETEARIEEIIQRSANGNPAPDTPEYQIGTLYNDFLNTDRIEELGLTPLQADIDGILASETHEDIARWFGRPSQMSMFSMGVTIDPGDPTRYVISTGQAGLGLPNRDYYLREDDPFPGHREAYVDYMTGLFDRAGIDNGRERAEDILALETAIAEIHWDRAQVRDRIANYNLMTVDELIEFAPGFDWRAFLEEEDVAGQEEIIVNTDTAVQALAQLFSETPVETLRSYLAFHFIDNHTAMLPEAYDTASFEFYGRRLNGTEEQRPRELRAVQFVNGQLGELIGQVYVEEHFPPEYREQMTELVEYLRRAFADRLETLEWMDDETRAEAFDKLEAFIPKIGYPTQWRDYSSIEMEPGQLIANSNAVGDWGRADSRSRLGGPIRQWEWFMSPQTVNAYYSSQRNEIVFPAAILQAPFFDPHADMAVNFGAIGGVIGHEMGHGFDDQGSRSDGTGLQRNWWTEFARNEFESRTAVLEEQYNGFCPIEGDCVRGAQTMGENIGDLGGLSIALHAYRMYLEDHGGGEEIDGFTPEQRFFMGWAQVWRGIQTEDSMRNRLITGVHSPNQYRVNGVVRNMDAWYDAFGVTEEDALYLAPENRVSIW
ncbi:M13 family metallopeptidase [Hyphobacterium sp. SN044]|uniref:M13 family metallopeptidase n=1 Tax=Hyphobacterium sp. SN044 TaxID=2912575 RepID=UPI001F15E6B7|nr:M13 family metallopeptidase [Hyphobacterium sp. SN044]MCF8879665.1 M13 family metallopeptidase [Hyphobacterium sp. SN044]